MVEKELAFAKQLAKDAGNIMKKYFRCNMDSEDKEDRSPITIADTEINDMVISRVKETFPEHGIIAEEGSDFNSEEVFWVCDPIDGTIPFQCGMPTCVFMLALCTKEDILLSVIYDPFQDRLFHAIKDQGAFLNDERTFISSYNPEKKQNITFDYWDTSPHIIHKTREFFFKQGLNDVNPSSIGFMTTIIVSGGSVGAILSGGGIWDMIPPTLMVREAGGVVTTIYGEGKINTSEDNVGIVMAAKELHPQLLEKVLEEIKGEKEGQQ